MRIDLFLKAARLVPARSAAQKLCDAGFVKVNGIAVRPSKEVKPADLIETTSHGRILTVEIVKMPTTKQVPKADATGLYSLISNIRTDRSNPVNSGSL